MQLSGFPLLVQLSKPRLPLVLVEVRGRTLPLGATCRGILCRSGIHSLGDSQVLLCPSPLPPFPYCPDEKSYRNGAEWDADTNTDGDDAVGLGLVWHGCCDIRGVAGI
jgi:hypothetical protein